MPWDADCFDRVSAHRFEAFDVTLFSLTLTDLELSERRRYRGMILTKWKMMLYYMRMIRILEGG